MKYVIGLAVAGFISMAAQAAVAQIIIPPPGAVMAPAGTVMMAPAPAPYCQPYTDRFTLGAETRITQGTACLQQDGSWQLMPTNAPVNYIVRGGATYLMPVRPFAVVVAGHRPHHHHPRPH